MQKIHGVNGTDLIWEKWQQNRQPVINQNDNELNILSLAYKLFLLMGEKAIWKVPESHRMYFAVSLVCISWASHGDSM